MIQQNNIWVILAIVAVAIFILPQVTTFSFTGSTSGIASAEPSNIRQIQEDLNKTYDYTCYNDGTCKKPVQVCYQGSCETVNSLGFKLQNSTDCAKELGDFQTEEPGLFQEGKNPISSYKGRDIITVRYSNTFYNTTTNQTQIQIIGDFLSATCNKNNDVIVTYFNEDLFEPIPGADTLSGVKQYIDLYDNSNYLFFIGSFAVKLWMVIVLGVAILLAIIFRN